MWRRKVRPAHIPTGCPGRQVPAIALGLAQIGCRVRIEVDGVAVEAPIERVSRHYSPNGETTVHVGLKVPDRIDWRVRVFSSMPGVTLYAEDTLTILCTAHEEEE
jgi:hypothetical protein